MSTGNKNTARAIFLSLLRRNRYTFNLTTSRCIRDKFISNTTEVLRVITFYVIRDTRANYKSRTIDINFGTICCCAPTFGQAYTRVSKNGTTHEKAANFVHRRGNIPTTMQNIRRYNNFLFKIAIFFLNICRFGQHRYCLLLLNMSKIHDLFNQINVRKVLSISRNSEIPTFRRRHGMFQQHMYVHICSTVITRQKARLMLNRCSNQHTVYYPFLGQCHFL